MEQVMTANNETTPREMVLRGRVTNGSFLSLYNKTFGGNEVYLIDLAVFEACGWFITRKITEHFYNIMINVKDVIYHLEYRGAPGQCSRNAALNGVINSNCSCKGKFCYLQTLLTYSSTKVVSSGQGYH
jgi:hypothetical protein